MSAGSLKQIKRRIRSVENTQKITRAMEMVAAAKLRRFQDFLESARPYTEKMEELFCQLSAEGYDHPFLTPHPGPLPSGERARVRGMRILVVFTSDTGLCGTYNSNVEEEARHWLEQNSETENQFIFVGKHGAGVFHHRGVEPMAIFSDLRVSLVDQILEGLRKKLEEAYLSACLRSGYVVEIHAVYTRMEGLARYGPVREKLLPLAPSPLPLPPTGERVRGEGNWIIEPDRKTVLDRLIPCVFEARLRLIFYHALVTEQIARMNAMRQATQNTKDMIEELTLLRNKARQAAITTELIEIVSGSRALKA